MKKLVRVALAVAGTVYYLTVGKWFWRRSSLVLHQQRGERIPCPFCGGDDGTFACSVPIVDQLDVFDARRTARKAYGLSFFPQGRLRDLLRERQRFSAWPKGVHIDYYRCNHCDVFYQDTPVGEAARREYYEEFFRGDTKFGRPHAYRAGTRIHRWPEYLQAVTKLSPGSRVLDVGCAEGLIPLKFRELGYDAYGIEPSEPMVRFGREDLDLDNLVVGEYTADSYAEGSFDLIASYHVVEHAHDQRGLIAATFRHLKPGGYGAISTPCADAALRHYSPDGGGRSVKHVFGGAHHVLLTEAYLTRAMRDVGYEILRIEVVDGPATLVPGKKTSASGEKEFGVNIVGRKPAPRERPEAAERAAKRPDQSAPDASPLLPPWPSLLARSADLWGESRRRARNGPKVLIANSVPSFYNSTNLESLLAVALTLRGADAHVLLCDRALAACMNTKFRKVSPDAVADGTFKEVLCDVCMHRGSAFEELGLPIHSYSDLVSDEERDEISGLAAAVPLGDIDAYVLDGIPVGEHARAGCLRYYSRATLEGEHRWEEVLRRYFEAALTTARALLRLTAAHDFEAACFHHGIYVPQGVVGEVCRASDVRVSTWNTAYRERCFVFSHGDTYHQTLLDEPVSEWRDMAFTEAHDQHIQEYLKSRWLGSQDWIYFHDTPDDTLEALVAETGIDVDRPTVGLLTNVMWDAQLHYRQNAFPDMLEWIRYTIDYFSTRPDLQLLIRVHPAEVHGLQRSRQFVVDEIAAAFPELPHNVFVIPPDSNVNTYAAMLRCNCVLIYGTKTGVELTSMRIPVIVAGEAWIRNKGLTTDVTSIPDYRQILDRLPLAESRLTESQAREARKYAFHFFMRRMIPVTSIAVPSSRKRPFTVSVESLERLLPGVDEGLDIICDGILTGSPYVYHAERELGA